MEIVELAIPMTALPDLERVELVVTLGGAVIVAGLAAVAVTVRRPRSPRS